MSRDLIRVVVFNDSPTTRAALRAALESAPDMAVVAEGESGADAAALVERAGADVVIMDVVMPGVDGYQATREIMRARPTPIVMVSAVVDPADRDVVFAALGAGALYIAEPPPAGPGCERRWAAFAELVRTISGARPRRVDRVDTGAPAAAPVDVALAITAIGLVASAGGPQAVSELLAELPRGQMPPILLVQHLAQGFCESYAAWLGEVSGHPVEVAQSGALALPGVVYLAPDDRHLGIGEDARLCLGDGAEVGGFRPAGTALLTSLAGLGNRAVAVILSGMGSDGAGGIETLVRAGGRVVVQDRRTAALDAMPRAAVATGLTEGEMSLPAIGRWLRERSGIQ